MKTYKNNSKGYIELSTFKLRKIDQKYYKFIKKILNDIFSKYDETNNGVISNNSKLIKEILNNKKTGGSTLELKCIDDYANPNLECNFLLYYQLNEYKIRCQGSNQDIIDCIRRRARTHLDEEEFINLHEFIFHNSRPKPITFDIIYSPHYKHNNCAHETFYDGNKQFLTRKNYQCREYNYEIVTSYEKSFIDNLSKMHNFIMEQRHYIDSLDFREKKILQDYCNAYKFDIYSLYINNRDNPDLGNILFDFINNYLRNYDDKIQDAFYKQINDLFKNKENCQDVIQLIDYENWVRSSRLEQTDWRIYERITGEDWIKIFKIFINDIDDIIKNAPFVKDIIYCYRGSNDHYITEGSHSMRHNQKKFFISDRLGSFTLDFEIAKKFSGGTQTNSNCIYRCALMPFTRVLYVAQVSEFFSECEILCPSNSIFAFKETQFKDAYNNNNIGNGLFSQINDRFNSADHVLYLTPQPNNFTITSDNAREIIDRVSYNQINNIAFINYSNIISYLVDISNYISTSFSR